MGDLPRIFWERLTRELADSSPLDLLIKLIATLILLALIYAARWLVLRAWSWLRRVFPSWWECCRKLNRARAAVDERGPGLWLAIKPYPHPPDLVGRLKSTGKLILTIANLKGGVGKTTLTANLAAYFANPLNDEGRPSRRVLVIDLDFQGSCSSMLFAGTPWRPSPGLLSQASEIICGAVGPGHQGQLGQPVTSVSQARGITAFYDLAGVENREMIRWLIGDQDYDIRYRLANLLLSELVLNHFDVILIDAPPRLTTASIQALCTSTHVLIPSIADPLGGEDPVGYFGLQLKAHEMLWPYLKILGVIGTITDKKQRGAEEPALIGAADRLRAALDGSQKNLRHILTRGAAFQFPYECSMRRSTPLARAAGSGIAYVSLGNTIQGRALRSMFDTIGKEVERRWHL